jgi:enoyl-CoA hydratase
MNELLKEKKGRIGIIIFNRPEVMNALNTPTLIELKNSLAELENDGDIRVIIIRGGEHFCAGADLRELKDKSPEDAEVFSRLGQGIFRQIENFEKPVIAAVSGFALGGGCEISLACDLRIAGEKARFGQPEINLGIIPGWGGTQRLVRMIGIGRAKEMIMTGKIIDAQEALSIGLVNTVTEDRDLIQKSEELAGIMAEKSQSVIGKIKTLMNMRPWIERGFDLEVNLFSESFATDDVKDGINEFLEKKKRV